MNPNKVFGVSQTDSGMVPEPSEAKNPPNASKPGAEFTVDVGDFPVDVGDFPVGAAGRSGSVRRRKRQTSIFTLILGSLLGALSAVVCSVWILSNWNPAALEPFREIPLVNQMLGPPTVPEPLTMQPTKEAPEKKFFTSVSRPAPEKQKLDTLPMSIKDDGKYNVREKSSATPTKSHSQMLIGLKFSVTNESKSPVRAFTGGYRLIGEGRTFAYFDGDFRKKVPGGIEPGETLRFTLKIRPTKSEGQLIACAEDTRWEVWLTDAWTGKQHFSVKKQYSELQPAAAGDR